MGETTPPATFQGTLRSYQAEGVSFLTQNEQCLLVDDIGLGKTVTALAALATCDGLPAVVVVQPNVQRQWARMAEQFLELPSGELLGDLTYICRGRKPQAILDVPIVICHYLLLADWAQALLDRGVETLIFDEIQELRHTGTQKYSAASDLSQAARYCWGLTGTPIYGYGAEMWSVTNIVEFQCLGDYESFTKEWCTGYGNQTVMNPEALGAHLKREGLMLRHRQKDVIEELPQKRRVVMDIDHDESLYQRMIAPAIEQARDYDAASFTQRGQIAREVDRESRQATGIAKAEHVADFVMSLIRAGEKPVVFAHHKAVHEAIEYRMVKTETPSSRITGSEGTNKKDTERSRFVTGLSKVCLIALRCGAGLDGLQHAGTCVVFAELDWSPAVHAQCEGRLHRIGAEHESILCYYLVSNTSHDMVMQEKLGLKIEQAKGILGDPIEGAAEQQKGEQAGEKHIQEVIRKLQGQVA